MEICTRKDYLYVETGFWSLSLGGAVLEDGDGIDLVQVYDPRLNQWTELAHMIVPRSGSAACVLNGHIHVIGKSLGCKLT